MTNPTNTHDIFRFCFLVLCAAAAAQGPSQPVGDDPGEYNMRGPIDAKCNTPVPSPGLAPRRCLPYQRNPDGYCTNGVDVFAGMKDTAQFSYLRAHDSRNPGSMDLASPRQISNVVSKQEVPLPNRAGLTDFATFFAQFLDHNIFSTGVGKGDDEEHLDIAIDKEDPIICNFTELVIPFLRSSRGCVADAPRAERPLNCLPAAVDLSGVYSSKAMFARMLRSGKKGRLLVKKRKKQMYMPNNLKARVMMTLPNRSETVSEKKHRKAFFAAGDHRANENPVLAALHTLFVREHNRLANIVQKKLTAADVDQHFSGDADEAIYQLAKRLNEGAFQRIVVEEFYPAMTGQSLGDVTYNPAQRPVISDLFSTAAFRVGHTMVGDRIQLRDASGAVYDELPVTELFFKPAKFLFAIGLDPLLRGAVRHLAQEIDVQVVDALRNHLFINVQGERANHDLVALNLQRGRDHNLPRFAVVRDIFNLPPVNSWQDITTDLLTLTRISDSKAYRTVDQVEAWVGMMAEDHVGRPMGRTTIAVWEAEFKRIVQGDRFNYQGDVYHPLLLSKFRPYVDAIRQGRRSMADVIVDNTGIQHSELPNSVWNAKA